MIIRPEGCPYDIDIGGETLLFNKRADTKAFRLYSLRYLAFVIPGAAIIAALMWYAGYLYLGIILAVLMVLPILLLFIVPNLPKVSYFITSGRVGLSNIRSRGWYGWYDYADVKKVFVRKFAKTITLKKGSGGLPAKIDLYLSEQDFAWFISDILPNLKYATVKGNKTK